MSQEDNGPSRVKRERSTRHPAVPLADSVELCRFIEGRGLDGLMAGDIASALGYKNIKTNTFSARLSAARQFGLLVLKDEGYGLTSLARSILHPVEPGEVPSLHRKAWLEPSLYADLAEQFAEKRVPDAVILGNVLYHSYSIIASAKQTAAEAFLESARFAGALGDDLILRPTGTTEASPSPTNGQVVAKVTEVEPAPIPVRSRPSEARIDLRLWGDDAGKVIRVRAPETITPESFERLLQALKLHVRIEESGQDED